MYKNIILFLLALTLTASPLLATIYIPEEDLSINPMLGDQPGLTFTPPPIQQTSGYKTWMDAFYAEAEFITTLQVLDPDDPNYGGMREGEDGGDGHLWDIIQTDNTEESIWVWCRYYELFGSNPFADNTSAAWQYCLANPAWEEEGGAGGYYRNYVSAWGLLCAMKYKQATGDDTYDSYGESCAQYLCDWVLDYESSPLNLLVDIWSAGCLYIYGDYVENDTYKQSAVDRAEDIKTHVETITIFLSYETWAMSGGAIVWGLVNSYFRENPAETVEWLTTYAPEMETYVSAGSWQNAWNAWYMLGHYATWKETDDTTYQDNYDWLLNHLMEEDGDDDGGIPAAEVDPDDMDQSWVSNYLTFMGYDGHFQGDIDVELIFFEAKQIAEGALLQWEIIADEPIMGFNLYRRELDSPSSGPTPVSLKSKLNGNSWRKINTAPITGLNPYSFTDREVDKDTTYEFKLEALLSSSLSILGTTEVTIDTMPAAFAITSVYPNPACDYVTMAIFLPLSSTVQIILYDLSGRTVLRHNLGEMGEGVHTVKFEIVELAEGTYTIVAESGAERSSAQLVVVR